MREKILRAGVVLLTLSATSIAFSEPMYPTNDSPVSNDADVFGTEPWGEVAYHSANYSATSSETGSAAKADVSATFQSWLGVTGLRGIENVRVTAGYERLKARYKLSAGESKDNLSEVLDAKLSDTKTQFGAAWKITDALAVATRFHMPVGGQDYFISSLTWRSGGNHIGLIFEPVRNTESEPQNISIAYTRAWDRFNLSLRGTQVSEGKFEGYTDHLDWTIASEVKVSTPGTLSLAWNVPGSRADSLATFNILIVESPQLQARYGHKVSESLDAALYATIVPKSSVTETFDATERTVTNSSNSFGLLLRKFL